MDAPQLAPESSLRLPLDGPTRGALGAALAWSLLGALVAVSGALAARRVAGAFDQPLDVARLLAAAAWLAVLAAATRFAWRARRTARGRGRHERGALAGEPPAARGAELAGQLVVSLAVLAGGLALSLPGSGLLALVAFWLLLGGGELVGWLAATRAARAPATRRDPPGIAAADARQQALAQLLQQLTRVRRAERELITGQLNVAFERGQRHGTAHVAFCPPLDELPEVECGQQAGPAAVVRLAQVQTFGIAIDVRLATAASEPCVVAIEVAASAPRAARRVDWPPDTSAPDNG